MRTIPAGAAWWTAGQPRFGPQIMDSKPSRFRPDTTKCGSYFSRGALNWARSFRWRVCSRCWFLILHSVSPPGERGWQSEQADELRQSGWQPEQNDPQADALPAGREREQPDPSLAASKAVKYAHRIQSQFKNP